MVNINWIDCVGYEVLQRVKEERNILHKIKIRKANWIGHILRRNCPLKHVNVEQVESTMEVTGRQSKRRTQLLDDVKDKIR
jgi:hypothetical protein